MNPGKIAAEITEPTLKLCWNEFAIQGAVEALRAAHLHEMAADIERQIKPAAIEEPTEFGSIVRAGYDEHSDRVLWVRTPDGWHAETRHGYHAYFVGLHDPEVLRVGVGERQDVPPEETEDYKAGVTDTAYDLRRKLIDLRSKAITSERRSAYDTAINLVAPLLGES